MARAKNLRADDFWERFNEVLTGMKDERGKPLSLLAFTTEAGVRYSTIYNCRNKKQIPLSDTLARIADYGNVTVDWLLRGYGAGPVPRKNETVFIYHGRRLQEEHKIYQLADVFLNLTTAKQLMVLNMAQTVSIMAAESKG